MAHYSTLGAARGLSTGCSGLLGAFRYGVPRASQTALSLHPILSGIGPVLGRSKPFMAVLALAHRSPWTEWAQR